jgi:putative ABC transport system ATP-binding protein
MGRSPLFAFEAVRLELSGRTILDAIDLTLDGTGITVLAGPSGAGKSTLLRLCNRLTVPTAGRVRFRGDDIAGLDPLAHRRRVGMVFQRPAPFPGTVLDNLHVACPGLDDDGAAAALDRAGLDRSFLPRRADDLSGGEAQRMCLARTLATEPEVLLLDEPTSSLDPVTSRDLEAQVRMLAVDAVSVVWVTHDLGQAERIAHELHVVVDGRMASADQRRHFLRGERHHDDEDDADDHDEGAEAS